MCFIPHIHIRPPEVTGCKLLLEDEKFFPQEPDGMFLPNF